MIEEIAEVAAAASETKETVSPYPDSERPTAVSMELPRLQDAEQLPRTTIYEDGPRPYQGGMELPKLKVDRSELAEQQAEDASEQNENAEADSKRIPCRNEKLEGQEHPDTGVRFEKRTIEVDGEEREVVVPDFDSAFDAQLPEDKLQASDKEQERECNRQLKEAVHNDPELRAKFTDEQLEQIENGDTPDGYTWHHDAEPGKMQLVDSETHQKTAHTGGRSFWGGGSEKR